MASAEQHQGFDQSEQEFARVKAAMRDAWNLPGAGYQEFAAGLSPAAEHLLAFLPVVAGMRMTDVATGTGLAAILAARLGAEVVALDFAPELLTEAKHRVAAEGLADLVQCVEGDAERLPFRDATFDAAISSFGAMFAPHHDVVSEELVRVVKPGGLIGLATWLPEEPNCSLLNLTAPYLPAPAQHLPSPLDWGRPEYVEALFGTSVQSISYATGNAPWRAESAREALAMLFRRALGPTMYVYQQFDSRTKLAVREDAMALLSDYLEPNGAVNLPRPYLLIRAVLRT